MRIIDDDDHEIKAGDRVSFSYGIPPVYVEGEVIRKSGRLVVLTPGHKPESCAMYRLRDCVGGFYKIKP